MLLVATLPSQAARPLTTEDASVVEDHACQVETWIDRSTAAAGAWFVPACNFGANIEWQAGVARERAQGRSKLAESYVQVKTIFPHEEGAPWNSGLAVGVTRRPQEKTHHGWNDAYVVVPLTLIRSSAPGTIHASFGWARDRARRRDATIWGVAAENGIAPRVTLLGEVFGENARRPYYRLGARYAAAPDHLNVDFSLVSRSGGTREERYLSIGVTLETGRILR